MIHRKNRDLQMSITDLERAAQEWEDRYDEAQRTIGLLNQRIEELQREVDQMAFALDTARIVREAIRVEPQLEPDDEQLDTEPVDLNDVNDWEAKP